ncbi:DUF2690 domain-containing protein [Nonomuraea spiralis]|uniref:DUF2690 domain-containing protein n=1 Tax=Nonomuraea spiralis TaxID=46182 RepID=A0ABV5IR04_9ACTN|nr:DUF2690 domain-containing protein [Nonomuraea spiralis]GGT08582.1 hypothetical protein GCM10010176_061310 [Nonomuraea spiralis]
MRSHRTAAVLAVVALALFPYAGANAAAEPPDAKAAPSCFGTACDGKDPALTGCAAGSYTVTYEDVPVRIQAFDGWLELRYGPGRATGRGQTCQVNWARFSKAGQGSAYNVWVERRQGVRAGSGADKRLTQYSGGDEGTGIIYSDQVYAPDVPARACVERAPGRRTGGPSAVVCTRAV